MPVFVKRTENRSYICEELLGRKNSNTPDFLERKLEKYIPVFVYGTLKSGGRLHDILSDAPCLGDAYTATKTYTMRESSGSFPVLFSRGKQTEETHAAYGEVYIVNAKILLELDRIEGNTEMYKRELRWVFMADQSLSGKSNLRPACRCWIYIAVPEFWNYVTTSPIKTKKMGVTEIYEWSPPKSNITTYPTTIGPEYKSSDDDHIWQEYTTEETKTFWEEYDREREERIARGDSFDDRIPF